MLKEAKYDMIFYVLAMSMLETYIGRYLAHLTDCHPPLQIETHCYRYNTDFVQIISCTLHDY